MEEYLSVKFIYYILFNNNENYKNQEWITDINVFYNMKKVLETLANNNFINSRVKQKVYDILMASREIRTDNYEERIDVINDIVSILNRQIHDESFIFYISEYCKRNGIKSNKFMVYDIDKEFNNLNISIAYDYIILKTFSSSVTDKEFADEYLEDLKENPGLFYEALNTFLEEFPEIFKNSIFFERMNILLNSIYEQNKSSKLKKLNKLFYKEIEKKCKV